MLYVKRGLTVITHWLYIILQQTQECQLVIWYKQSGHSFTLKQVGCLDKRFKTVNYVIVKLLLLTEELTKVKSKK